MPANDHSHPHSHPHHSHGTNLGFLQKINPAYQIAILAVLVIGIGAVTGTTFQPGQRQPQSQSEAACANSCTQNEHGTRGSCCEGNKCYNLKCIPCATEGQCSTSSNVGCCPGFDEAPNAGCGSKGVCVKRPAPTAACYNTNCRDECKQGSNCPGGNKGKECGVDKNGKKKYECRVCDRVCQPTAPPITATPPPPPPPTNLTTECWGNGTTASIIWTTVPSATYYALRIDDTSDGLPLTNCNTIGAGGGGPMDKCVNAYDYKYGFTIVSGHTYNWWMHACNANGCSSPHTTGPSFQCQALPTSTPTVTPTKTPTLTPTRTPTIIPTRIPTQIPSPTPTEAPQCSSTPVDIVISLDRSSSMGGTKLAFEKQAAIDFITIMYQQGPEFKRNVRLGAVTWAGKWLNVQSIAPTYDYESVARFVYNTRNLSGDSYTCIECALQKSINIMNDPNRDRNIVLMSDGIGNRIISSCQTVSGSCSSPKPPACMNPWSRTVGLHCPLADTTAINLAQSLKNAGVDIYVVGYGTKPEPNIEYRSVLESTLEGIGGENYFYGGSQTNWSSVFAQIATMICPETGGAAAKYIK